MKVKYMKFIQCMYFIFQVKECQNIKLMTIIYVAVMDATYAVVKRRPEKKFRIEWDLNPVILVQCSTNKLLSYQAHRGHRFVNPFQA